MIPLVLSFTEQLALQNSITNKHNFKLKFLKMKLLTNVLAFIRELYLIGIAVLSVIFLTSFIGWEYLGYVSLLAFVSSVALYDFAKTQNLVTEGIIPVQNATARYTKQLIRYYAEMPMVTSFLTSFFTPTSTKTYTVEIAVQRNKEFKAVDVFRYSDGKRVKFDQETTKEFLPPFYHLWTNLNNHRLYDVVISGLSRGDVTYFQDLMRKHGQDLMKLRYMMERAIEFQCSQVFHTGIITLEGNTDINFNRLPQSIVAYNPANDWSDNSVVPTDIIKTGIEFLRVTGKANVDTVNVIMGSNVLDAYKRNTNTKDEADIRHFETVLIREPQRTSTGGVIHGRASAGQYKFNVWTYPASYDTEAQDGIPYVDPNVIIVLPEDPRFELAYAAVPQIPSDNGRIPQVGDYLIQDERNEIKGFHRTHMKVAPVAIPTAVDQIFTAYVLN